ncbi:sialic acid TRAP transporter substrate-binding protein SiaP [Acuticoccus sp. MNP-M23]|uniref:sialic acid TRAP transporter substrate-binding protein SiaP n=1 Tax=Acuticoccus sp. MNP-M23 TaxID=3072793 RepID=UPI002815490A|nr:sialic acid TRAP transporter substrate-binding protein SiaP [Acuticoccus sp. MNP-M23]WMS43930.1 sialic acid TRAP transporter substrate-binding protein SiaP [Acuticoccus sp. MNP-M23]
MTVKTTRRTFLAGTAVLGAATLAAPGILRAQETVIRWGEMLAPSHPQVQMIDRIAAAAKEASDGRIDVQSFPNGQLGSGKDMMDMVVSGALAMTTDGAAALGSLLPPLSVLEAPYLWTDPAQLAKVPGSDVFKTLNDQMVSQRGMRMLAVTYYGKRHVTTGNKAVHTAADMQGLKLRVPPVDTFIAMVEAWGGQATPINFNELYLALSQGAVDGQENPLPTIASAKLNEVQKYLILTGHIITPRIVIANEAWLSSLDKADREILMAAIDEAVPWQNQQILDSEAALQTTLADAGMTVIEPDVESFRKPVLEQLPPKFESVWGKGTWEALAAL